MSALHASAARTTAVPKAAPPVMRAAARQSRYSAPPIASLATIAAGPAVQRQCADCARDEEEDGAAVQPRLEVGPVGDRYEQEADSIAARVMAMPAPDSGAITGDVSPAEGAVQRACSACSSSREDPSARRFADPKEDEKDPKVRARRDGGGGETIAASDAQLTSGGSELPAATRSFFEGRMGRDLGGVRVHSGRDAAAKNDSISARAFTYKNHVWLGAGESASPSFTMAHELAHVMQQTSPGPIGPQRRAIVRRQDRAGMMASSSLNHVRRVAPAVAAPAAGLTITAAMAKCAIGAVIGAFFDSVVQAGLYAIREGTLRVWEMTVDYCSLILSAAVGCVAAPISAVAVEPVILARYPAIASRQGTVIGWLLLKAAAGAGMFLPKAVVKGLLKLGCISSDQAQELGGGGGDDDAGPLPAPPPEPGRTPTPTPGTPRMPEPQCEKLSGDVQGHTRVLMKVNGTQYLDADERARLEGFAEAIKPTDHHVKVHGVASEDGPAAFNERLSCTRAIAGREALIARGIDASRIDGVYQHGEVEGPKTWQRAVVFELTGGSTPSAPGGEGPVSPPPGREGPVSPPGGGGETPPPTTPGTGGVAPKMTLKSIRYTSDHHLLRDYDKDWSLGGAVPDVHWRPENPDSRMAPISQTRGTPLTAEATVDIEPVNADPAVVTLSGMSSESMLGMRGSALMGGGTDQKIMLRASETLYDDIWEVSGQNVHWVADFGGHKSQIAVTTGHEVLITYGQPKGPITTKRARTAIDNTMMVGDNPHDIIKHQVRSYGFYNLKNPIEGEPWQFADVMPPKGPGSDCQSIIRFIMAVNDTIGLPGEARGLAVYADPAAPDKPKTAPLNYLGGASGGMFNYPGYGLIDGGGNPNNYEATMEYKLEGSKYFPDVTTFQRYYPGGIPGAAEGKMTLDDVLHVFTKMVHTHWVLEGGKYVLRHDEIFCYRGREDCDKVKVKEP